MPTDQNVDVKKDKTNFGLMLIHLRMSATVTDILH